MKKGNLYLSGKYTCIIMHSIPIKNLENVLEGSYFTNLHSSFCARFQALTSSISLSMLFSFIFFLILGFIMHWIPIENIENVLEGSQFTNLHSSFCARFQAPTYSISLIMLFNFISFLILGFIMHFIPIENLGNVLEGL